MSHGFDLEDLAEDAHLGVDPLPRLSGILKAVQAHMDSLNTLITTVGGLALVAACAVLTFGVALRYVFKIAIDWQDETTVFLVLGAVFLSSAAVQARRGHVSIDVFASFISPRMEYWRLLLVDVLSLQLCVFLTWKSGTQFHESWLGDEHSISSWAPPMWIPYSLMTVGLLLLSLQILLQIVVRLATAKEASL